MDQVAGAVVDVEQHQVVRRRPASASADRDVGDDDRHPLVGEQRRVRAARCRRASSRPAPARSPSSRRGARRRRRRSRRGTARRASACRSPRPELRRPAGRRPPVASASPPSGRRSHAATSSGPCRRDARVQRVRQAAVVRGHGRSRMRMSAWPAFDWPRAHAHPDVTPHDDRLPDAPYAGGSRWWSPTWDVLRAMALETGSLAAGRRWCCSTSTTAPLPGPRRQRRRSTASRIPRGRPRRPRPRRALVVWSAAPRPLSWLRRCGSVYGNVEATAVRRRLQDRRGALLALRSREYRGPRDASDYRTEHDSHGRGPGAPGALWGAQTQRAVENFPISGTPIEPALIHALALVKAAAAQSTATSAFSTTDQADGDRGRRRASPTGSTTTSSRSTSSRPAPAPAPT